MVKNGKQPRSLDLRRTVVVGTTGSGKTTVAAELARRLGVSHVEMDALYWGPNWTSPPAEEFEARVKEAVRADSWVLDGGYGVVRHIVWSRATSLVWLDLPLRTLMVRLVRRTVSRAVTGEELWNGNRESLRAAFLSRESLLLWALKSFGRHRRQYPVHLERPEFAHLGVVRLSTPKAVRRWLDDTFPPG